MLPQRGEQRAQALELAVGVCELPRRARRSRRFRSPRADRRSRTTARRPALHPQPLTLEAERVRVAGRQRLLDGVERGRGRAFQQRLDVVGSRSSWSAADTDYRARPPSLTWAGRLIFWRRSSHSFVVLLLRSGHCGREQQTRRRSPPGSPRRCACRTSTCAATGALAVDLSTGEIVYARNERLSLLPASNEKLAVAYTALTRLGPAYRFRTEVLGLGSLDEAAGVWHGDLVLKGHGDPTLDGDDLAALAARRPRVGDQARHRRGADGRERLRRRSAPGRAGRRRSSSTSARRSRR